MPEDAPFEVRPTPNVWWRFLRRVRSRKVVVQNASMRPTLEPGDRLRVDPRAYRGAGPARGDLVVLRDPERPGHLLVKRVVALPGDASVSGTVPLGTVRVEGDNPASRDSRAFGAVPFADLQGRVWLRYYPAERRRRFPP